MGRFADLCGQVFERLTVVGYAGVRSGRTSWWCRCVCGKLMIALGCNLKQRRTQSCGCLKKDLAGEANVSHGHTRGGVRPGSTYMSWLAMKARCENPANHKYPRYGGRGIRICESWRSSFETFHRDMGDRPPGTTLDRIDSDGNYEPGNCRWATSVQQYENRRARRDLKGRFA